MGWIVLISAEMFSGASLGSGFWSPWTLLLTYWLYFAHFFACTTLAVRTGRTSLTSLYWWGVLFGLYESWITKVIWAGFSGDGKLVLGHVGPWGMVELSMVFVFHPVISLILPLVVACILHPPLQRLFPDLAWFTGSSRWSRAFRTYLIVNLGAVVAMNSGGPLNLALNVSFAALVLAVLSRLARAPLPAESVPSIVVFGRRGTRVLSGYLALLYGLTYFYLRPEARPSAQAQILTLGLYVLAVWGLYRQGSQKPRIDPPEFRGSAQPLVLRFTAWLLGIGLMASPFRTAPPLLGIVVVGFVFWACLTFLLPAIASWNSWRAGPSISGSPENSTGKC